MCKNILWMRIFKMQIWVDANIVTGTGRNKKIDNW